MRKQLTSQGGTPTERDVQWALLNLHSVDDLRQGNMGLYRNRRFEQAEILRRVDKRLDLAFETYLGVCYIDLNGPENTSGNSQYPMFVPKHGSLAPGVMEIVVRLMTKLDLNVAAVEARFVKTADTLWQVMKLPVAPQKAARTFGAALRELV